MSTVYCVQIRVWSSGRTITRSFESMVGRELFLIAASQYATVEREWLAEAEPEQEATL